MFVAPRAMAAVSVTSTVERGGVIKANRLNQHIGALVVSLGGFVLGVTLGWYSSAGETLRNILAATAAEIGLVGAILNAGACIGVILVPFLGKFLSRTATAFLTMPVFVAGWLLICLANQNVLLFLIGRLICGVCGGTFSVLTPIFVAEIAEKRSRERLLTFFQLLLNCGVMYAFVMAHVLEEHDAVWRYSLTCTVPCAAIALVATLPESPLYHLTRDDENNARKSLRWYRGERYKLEDELDELDEFKRLAVVRSANESIRTMRKRRVLRSYFACFGVLLLQQLSGVNTMTFYALTLFNTGGSGELTGSEQTLVVGGVQIASCLLATALIDVLGRRVLLTVSSALMGLFLALLGWFHSLRNADPEYDDVYSWMPPTWIALFFASFNFGLGPVSWSLLGDSFPTETRTTAAAAAACLGWLVSFAAAMVFGEMLTLLGVPKTMWLFAGFCWSGAIFCALVVQDTSGKSLAEIQDAFAAERPETGVENASDAR